MIHRLFETPRSHSKSIPIFLDEVKHSVNCNYKSPLFFFDFDVVSNFMILSASFCRFTLYIDIQNWSLQTLHCIYTRVNIMNVFASAFLDIYFTFYRMIWEC